MPFARAAAMAVCALSLSLLGGCWGNDDATGPAKQSSWPVFHGTPDLLGVADTTLPRRPALLWKQRIGKSVKSSPVVADGRVYVGNGDGELCAVDLADGRILWRFKAGDTIESVPLAAGGAVYVGSTDKCFYAVDAATGNLRWKYEAGDKFMGGANSYQPAGRALRIIAGSYDQKLYCFDAATGHVEWTFETAYYINGTPAVVGDQIIFGGCDGQVHILSAEDGTEVRSMDAGAYVAGGVAVADGRGYLAQMEGKVLCFDLAAGKALWEFSDAEAEFYSSPAVGPQEIVVGCRDFSVYCLDRATGKLRWKHPTLANVDSSPAIAGDKVVVGSQDGRLYLFALATGKLLWSYDVGQPITSSPAVASGLVVVASEDGYVYAFGRR